jgi:hypothetical protein
MDVCTSKVVVYILSAACHSARREDLRNVYSRSSAVSVYFVVGRVSTTTTCSARAQAYAINESDVVTLAIDEKYTNLARKIKLGFAHLLLLCSNMRWLVLADDDVYVHVDLLGIWLQQQSVASQAVVVGNIWKNMRIQYYHDKYNVRVRPHRILANKTVYPPFPNGACGAVFSRAAVDGIVRLDGVELGTGDTSLGIWLEQMDVVTFVHLPQLFTKGDGNACFSALVSGHRAMGPRNLRKCANASWKGPYRLPDLKRYTNYPHPTPFS